MQNRSLNKIQLAWNPNAPKKDKFIFFLVCILCALWVIWWVTYVVMLAVMPLCRYIWWCRDWIWIYFPSLENLQIYFLNICHLAPHVYGRLAIYYFCPISDHQPSKMESLDFPLHKFFVTSFLHFVHYLNIFL